jgi:hypothetical protein
MSAPRRHYEQRPEGKYNLKTGKKLLCDEKGCRRVAVRFEDSRNGITMVGVPRRYRPRGRKCEDHYRPILDHLNSFKRKK